MATNIIIRGKDDAVHAYSQHQIDRAVRELDGAKAHFAQGQRVNKEAGEFRVRRVMHPKLYFNALAAGEDPRRDQGYLNDMARRGLVIDVPVFKTSVSVQARKLGDAKDKPMPTIPTIRVKTRLGYAKRTVYR